MTIGRFELVLAWASDYLTSALPTELLLLNCQTTQFFQYLYFFGVTRVIRKRKGPSAPSFFTYRAGWDHFLQTRTLVTIPIARFLQLFVNLKASQDSKKLSGDVRHTLHYGAFSRFLLLFRILLEIWSNFQNSKNIS